MPNLILVDFAEFIIVTDFIIKDCSGRYLTLLPKFQYFINYLESMLDSDYFQFLYLNSRKVYFILSDFISQKDLLLMLPGQKDLLLMLAVGWNFNLLVKIMMPIMKIRKFVIETEDFVVDCFGCFIYFEGSDSC